jgi:hypothetical protein
MINNLKSIFRDREDGFSDLTSFMFSEYPEFFKLFTQLVERRVISDDITLQYVGAEESISISREVSVPRTRLDILISSDQYELAIENKKLGYKLRKNQLLDYELYMNSLEDEKLRVIILLCPSLYRPPRSELPTMPYCKISYKDLRGIVSQLVRKNYHSELFTKYDEYLGVIDMSPFKAFDLESVEFVRDNSRKYHAAENKMITDFDHALKSVLFSDNGNPHFEHVEVLSTKDRRWLDRKNFIGDYSAVVRWNDNEEYLIWLAFQFSEESIDFRVYYFTPFEEKATELGRQIEGHISLDGIQHSCGVYKNEFSITFPLDLREFSEWKGLKVKLRKLIDTVMLLSAEVINPH